MLHISTFLRDKDKISLSATSKSLNELKLRYRYCDRIYVLWISHLPYFDNFESVEIFSVKDKVPKNVKYIHHAPLDDVIPSNVTHLSFFYYLDDSTRIKIPLSVTHLSFGSCFDKTIYGKIPSSVTHLTFDQYYKELDDYIPKSVTHLKFGYHFNKFNK